MKMNEVKSYITETHDNWHCGHIECFWTRESFVSLSYEKQPFNNNDDIIKWKRQGYVHPESHYTGLLCDMKKKQTDWNNLIINWFESNYSAKDVGTSYYKMPTGVILPLHGDTFVKYRKLFNTTLDRCFRAIVFLQDWKSGHYFEIDNKPIVNWKAGDYVFWRGNLEHMAANIGIEDRYTLQITAHD